MDRLISARACCVFQADRMPLYNDDSPLTKTSVRTLILSAFEGNDPGFTFSKFADRCYHFTREAKVDGAFDSMKIKVHLKKGKLYCSLLSLMDASLKDKLYVFSGLLNKQMYLTNSAGTPDGYPENIYFFENSVASLKRTLQQLYADFNTAGRQFVLQNDARYADDRLKKGLAFIHDLRIDKAVLQREFYEESAKAAHSIPGNRHPVFCDLVETLEQTEKGKYAIENHLFAFEILHKYMFD